MINMSNKYLNLQKTIDRDEYYTLYETIEDELKYYHEYLKGKIVYCNCDDYKKSNFVKYFNDNFDNIGLKGLISTDFKTGNIYERYVDIPIHTDNIPDGISYDSPKASQYMLHADIVITNPPFSKISNYIDYLFEYNKSFLIIGNMNTLCTKKLFHYVVEKRIWYGHTLRNGNVCFIVDNSYIPNLISFNKKDNMTYVHINSSRWLTNIGDISYVQPLKLSNAFSQEIYKKYDNLDAINVDKVNDIPFDYDDPIGVPITFLDKYNPEQFTIIGLDKNNGSNKLYINRKGKYKRIIIVRNKNIKNK